MHLSDLIETLQDLADEIDGDPEVILAIQPSWPLAHNLVRVTASRGGEDDPRIWLAASQGHPDDTAYAPKQCWSEGIVYHDEDPDYEDEEDEDA